ncbi:MAG: hypothetical protein ACKVP0_07465 [Pirellulaceae bacterium]
MLLRRDAPALLLFDPAGELARKAAKYLALQRRPFLYDALAETKNVLGYDFLPRSFNPDPDQQEAENNESISDGISVLVRAEGKLDASANKNIRLGLYEALSLYIYQKTPVPFYLLKDCFVGESDAAQFLLQNCARPEWVLRFQYYHGLRGQQREYLVGAAERRLTEACECVQFRRRCIPTFNLAELLCQGGALLIDGSSQGNLSRQHMTFLMGMLIILLISLARSGKLKRKVIVAIDEAMNAAMIDGNVARALAEAPKWLLEFHLITQNPLALPEPIRESVFQNSDRLYFFKQVNPDAAMFAARICGIPTLDPMRVKETITRIRQEHTGVEIRPVSRASSTLGGDGRTSDTISEGHISIPIYTPKEEVTNVRYSFDEQILLEAQRVMNVGVGECLIRDGNVVVASNGPLPMLRMPAKADLVIDRKTRLTIGERTLQQYLETLKTTPPYQTPTFTISLCPTTTFKTAME